MTDPIATLYVFKRNGRAVAVGLGQVPPDIGECEYDSLLRIPIMKNGDRPRWRAFTWNQRETMGAALNRARWPEEETP